MKKKLFLYITKGLPASGKSTWAKEFVDKSDGRVINICKDDLRAMLHNEKHSSGREDFVMQIRDMITIKAFENHQSVIWSDTNLNSIHEQRARELVIPYKALVEIKDFTDVPVKTCIERDLKRLKSVGEKVIKDTWKKYIKPPTFKISQDSSLPKTIICDMDGTLALIDHRNAYNAAKCEDDLLNESVANVVNSYYKNDYKILLVSGRKEEFREQTENWLKKYKIPYHLLIMRKEGDYRKDNIVKKELFDTYIKDKYYIEFVLDDRDQVVEMWRDLGFSCFQVDYGDF
ncbi:MAG: AAA family ATPase [Candidatus Sericytochromatia bacterium]